MAYKKPDEVAGYVTASEVAERFGVHALTVAKLGRRVVSIDPKSKKKPWLYREADLIEEVSKFLDGKLEKRQVPAKERVSVVSREGGCRDLSFPDKAAFAKVAREFREQQARVWG